MDNSQISITDEQLDRLVDGELSLDDQHKLLLALEEESGGYRRCALAFVEAQTFQQLMQEAIAPIVEKPSALQLPEISKPNNTFAWRALAVAACLMITFTIGALWQSSRQNDLQKSSPDNHLIVQESKPLTSDKPHLVDNSSRQDLQPVLRAFDLANFVIVAVRGENGQEKRIALPLVDDKRLDQQLRPHLKSVVSDAIRRNYRLEGYDIKSRFRYAPYQLADGQTYVMPVEETQVVPIAMTIY